MGNLISGRSLIGKFYIKGSIMKYLMPCIYALIFTASLNAVESNEQLNPVGKSEEISVPRIRELIPKGWLAYPAIDPAIPENYVGGSLETNHNFDEASRILWGEKRDVEMFAKDQTAQIKHPVFYLRHASDFYQNGPNSFSGEKSIADLLKKSGVKNTKTEKMQWGEYPVLACENKLPDGSITRFAWIGVNSDGHVLMVNIFSPKPSSVQGEKQTQEVWDKFLHQSRQLEEREFFIARGMDMRDGYTNYTSGTASLKAIAEKRKSDDKLAVLIRPMSPGISFNISGVEEGLMGSKWKHLELCTKIYGQITEKNGNTTNIIDVVITVLTKSVEEYSFNMDKTNHPLNTVIHTQNGEKIE